MNTLVKICGITRIEDALLAAESGAHYIGVIVEVEESPRSVTVAIARRIIANAAVPVVVLLDKEQRNIEQLAGELKPFAVQVVGDVSVAALQQLKLAIKSRIWKTLHVPPAEEDEAAFNRVVHLLEQYHTAGVAAVVLDTLVMVGSKKKGGGTGQICNWHLAQRLVAGAPLPVFLAGGINPDNVLEAILRIRPYGIDLSSGVECEPGKKDPQKIAHLMNIIKSQ